ncbi:MAG: peptidylprolyl isomerase [Acidobacteria bacterium]|uniref:peptidylprolyl isomerase n=1 Tax=Candidatus Polarisedimenticola svalbardensis TaxID=2886004 RepID=A0A8J6Y633_9BACT|nr:peptidylprolyl isomerase [Candidatus Polarisedimenticola svalbardensis]
MIALVSIGLASANEKLLDASALDATAPDKFNVTLETTKGDVVIAVDRSLAPIGADRLYNLVKNGFFDDCRFFRVVPNFVVQFGLNGSPAVNSVWREARIQDEPVKSTNARGTITFAKASQPNTRTTQMFINLVDNARLDGMGFSPFGKVISGMEFIDGVFAGYGGSPRQDLIISKGNAYLESEFPRLDFIKKAVITPHEE